MSTSKDIILAFDLYGTLLSTASIAEKLASHFGEERAASLAATWRSYQLQYTWRLNSMQTYQPFSTITHRSLSHALRDYGLTLDEDGKVEMMRAYDELSTFADVAPALETLKHEAGITAVVFSNGTRSMVDNSVRKSRDLSPYQDLFKHMVVVEEVQKFKPHPDVYRHLARTMGKGEDEKDMSEMWLVSGNPFDVVGARSMGMKAAWVDRDGSGWSDSLVDGDAGQPTIIVKALTEVVDAVRKHIA